MATKKGKGTKGVKPSKANQKRTETPRPQAARASAPDNDLTKFWMNVQTNMGEQITQIMERQQKFYEDFSGKWTKASSDITDSMGKMSMSSDGLTEIQKAWDRHQQRMNQNLESIMKSENEAYETLNAKWKALSEDMTKAVMALGNPTDMRKAQERFLLTWAELSKEMTRQLARSIEMGNGEIKALRDTWMGIVEDMDHQARDLTEKNPEMADNLKGWVENSKELNKHLMDHLDSSSDDVVKLQTMWTHQLSNITSEFVKSVWDMNMKWFEENGKAFKGSK